MNPNFESQRTIAAWIRIGIVAGIVACIAYPAMVFIPMPRRLTVLVASSFGPALALASVGPYHFLKLHRDTAAAQVGALSNVLAGALVTAMLLVQMAVKFHRDDYLADSPDDESVRSTVFWIWDTILGLDVAFDVFIGLGTLFFAIAMLRHPKVPKAVSWSGVFIGAVVILAMNFFTFPTPPADAGLFDPGPVSGLWYAAVVIVLIRALPWVRTQSSANELRSQ